MRELIHFAHGNGFPSPCYKQLFLSLTDKFDYTYIDMIGHNPAFPVTDNWQLLVDEVIASVSAQSTEPVIGIGHSLGGVLTFLAAIERPELFKAVVMLDSPLIGPFKSHVLKLAKWFGIIDRVTPAFRTKGRQQHWRSKEHVIKYLKSRELFRTFTPDCLNDYIDNGIDERNGEYYLRFDRIIEYKIYRTIPHIIPKFVGQLQTPTALIYGDKTVIVDKMDRRYMKRKFGVQCFETKGTHLFPFEHPKLAAEQVLKALDAIL